MIQWFKSKFVTKPEKILVARAVDGDREAFGELYLKYIDGIYRYIFFRINQQQQEAEDLTETVFFRAFQSLDSFEMKKGNFKNWLYRIAHNLVIDYYRKSRPMNDLNDQVIDDKRGPEEITMIKTEMEQLIESMNSLSDEQKQMVTLKYIEGLSNVEIGKILNKNQEAIRALQYRAVKQLKKILNYDKS